MGRSPLPVFSEPFFIVGVFRWVTHVFQQAAAALRGLGVHLWTQLMQLPHCSSLAGQPGLMCQAQWHKLKGVTGWHCTMCRGLGVTGLAGPCLQHIPAGIHWLAVLELLPLVVLDLSRTSNGSCMAKYWKDLCLIWPFIGIAHNFFSQEKQKKDQKSSSSVKIHFGVGSIWFCSILSSSTPSETVKIIRGASRLSK